MRSRRHLEILNLRDVKVRRHSLMRETLLTRNVILKQKYFKTYLGERIKKEVVIIRIESYFSAFH